MHAALRHQTVSECTGEAEDPFNKADPFAGLIREWSVLWKLSAVECSSSTLSHIDFVKCIHFNVVRVLFRSWLSLFMTLVLPPRFILPILTCYAKKTPPELDEALRLLKTFHGECTAPVGWVGLGLHASNRFTTASPPAARIQTMVKSVRGRLAFGICNTLQPPCNCTESRWARTIWTWPR